MKTEQLRFGRMPTGRRGIQLFLICLLLLAGIARISSLPAQRLLKPGEWTYDALEALSLEQGEVFFTGSILTVAQAENILQEIDEEKLSEAGRVLYEKLDAFFSGSPRLTWNPGALSLGAEMILTPEFFFKTGEQVPWIYDYHERNPFVIFPLSLGAGPWFAAEMAPYAGQNEYAALLHHNYVNIPWEPASQFDLHFPQWAYLSAGFSLGQGSGIHFTLGNGADFFGLTRTGSVALSEYMRRTTFARLNIYSPRFMYSGEVIQHQVNKYQYMHSLHIKPFKSLSVSFTESAMVNAPLELRFLNPFMVFHGYEPYKTYRDYNEDLANGGDNPPVTDPAGHSRAGMFFSTKIEFQPVKRLRLYGIFAMDQLQLPIEHDQWEDLLTPDALAFQAGLEMIFPVDRKNGAAYWKAGLEGVYTYPFMYVLNDKGYSFYGQLDEIDNIAVRYWTGSPFGPDSIAGTLWVGRHDPLRWSADLSFLFLVQGERSGTGIFDDDDYRARPEVAGITRSPTGIPVYTSTVSLKASWLPLPFLTLSLRPGYRIVNNNGHIEGETVQGFELAFSASLAL